MSSLILGKTLLNQYRVEEFITATPLGELYRVTDERSNKSFALTLLPKEISDDLEAIKEIESKSRTLQNINHPNLAKYLGLYQTPTLAFLLEKWIDGPSLNDIFKQDILLNAEEVITYTKSLCNALEALHKQNFLHLNLSPELIGISQKGEIKLSGIANATPLNQKASHKLNKHAPLYTSPEELKQQTPSPASDVYSLAILLYQLITNKWINGKQAPKSNDAIRKAHLETNPPAPISFNKNIPDNFSRMLLWALRKNPDDRLKNTTELLSSLALSVQISIDKIPLHASGIHAPVTSAVLHSWKFLPPPKAGSDTIPLEDRLANISSPIPKKKSNVRVMPVFFLFLFAGIFALFFFIRPVEPAVSTLPTITPFVPNITPPPTFTLEPRPTKEFGGQIAFTCTRGNYNQVCIVNRDGSGYTQVTDMEASNYYPVFTPDGSSLLFASNRNGPFDFFLLVFSQREIIPITNNVGNVISPDYSPDGRQIVFANKVGDNPTAIWMVNADGLNPRLIYTGARDIVAVAWSPNGEKIAYAMSMGVPQEYEIYTMDVNGRNHLKVSQGLLGIGGSVDWSLDSRSLLIHAGPFGNKDIFRIDAETGDFTQLTNGGNNAGASYSPDGNYIVFNSLRNDDQADLYIMRADGTNQVQLTNHPEPDWGARWID
jgi:Tol biopolymer transport system component